MIFQEKKIYFEVFGLKGDWNIPKVNIKFYRKSMHEAFGFLLEVTAG